MRRSIGHGMMAAWLALLAVAVPAPAVMAQSSRSDDVAAVVEAAQEAQQAGEWEDAARAWLKVTKADPDNGTAWFNLGYCLHAEGMLEKAIKAHKRAAEFDDYEGIALYNLGCAYALQGKSDRAFAALGASMEAGFDVGGSAGGDSDLESLRDDPRFKQFARSSGGGRGIGWGGGGGDEVGQMIEGLIGAVRGFLAENAPKTEGMFMELAQQAIKTFGMLQKELSENEQFAPIAEMLGKFMGGRSAGDRQPGRDMSARAPRSEEHEAHDEHEAHAEHEAHDGALESRRAKVSEADVRKYAEIAQRHQQSGEFKKAAKAWHQVVEAQPEIGGAWFGLAYSLHMSGDYEKAIKAHKKAASFDEFEGIATYNLACAYAMTGNEDKAFKALKAAAAAGFDVADAMPGDSDLKSLRDDPRWDRLLDMLSDA